MTAGVEEQARRADAGTVEATERDGLALRWIAEQYTVRDDVLAVLLGRLGAADPRRQAADRVSLPTVRHAVRRWVRAGWTTRRRALDCAWTVPTADGYRLAGLEPRGGPEVADDAVVMNPWSLRMRQLGHVHAVGVVRLDFEARLAPGQRWVCERQLRREARAETRGTILRHIFDGAVEGADGERVGIDVDLTLKSPVAFGDVLRRPVSPVFKGARLYAPERMVPILRTRLDGLRPTVPTDVHPLPDLGIGYMEG